MGDTYPRLRVAAAQAGTPFLDRDAAVERACALISEAGELGVDMLGFAENFIPGHPVWYYFHPAFSPQSMDMATALFANSVEIPGPQMAAICAAAAAARVFVVIGVTERRASTTGTLFNTQVFIDRKGAIVGRHQKLMPTMSERLVHTGGGGDSQRTWPSEFGPVSGLVCGENSNPLAQAVIASQYSRIHVASWPHHFKPTPGFPDMPEMSLLVARNVAYTCKCFVISACGIVTPEMAERLPATEADREWLRDPAHSGGSVIIDPRGVAITEVWPGDREGILYADIDLELTVRSRLVHDFGGHYNRPDVFHLQVNQASQPLVSHVSGPGWQGLASEPEARVIGSDAQGASSQPPSLLPAPQGLLGKPK